MEAIGQGIAWVMMRFVAFAFAFILCASVVYFLKAIRQKDFGLGVVSVFSFVLGALAFLGILADLFNL